MSIDQFIDNEVKGNEVVLFMRNVPVGRAAVPAQGQRRRHEGAGDRLRL